MSIEIEGLEPIQKKLKKLQNLDKNLKRAMQGIGEKIRTSIDESFEREKSPFGERWKPISSSTAFNYAGGRGKAFTKSGKSHRKGFIKMYGIRGDKKLLIDTGNLKGAWGVKANNSSVTVESYAKSSGFPYGLTHQFGSLKRGIPARPFLPVDSNKRLEPNLKRDILEMIDDEIKKVVE